MDKYIMDAKNRATFNKAGNIKLGNTWNFSTVYGNDVHTVDFNGETLTARGTCGKHCTGCKSACYVKKSYRYPSVVYSHIKNTLAIRLNPDAAFHDLTLSIEKARINPDTVPKTEKPDFLKDLLRG